MLVDERKQVPGLPGSGQDENSCQALSERPRLPDVRVIAEKVRVRKGRLDPARFGFGVEVRSFGRLRLCRLGA